VLTAPAALAVPSFARQTGMACEACHTVYPELTHFGRVFKANGYVLANLKQVRDVTAKKEQLLELAQTPPLSIMVQASYSQLTTTLPDLSQSAPGVAQNGTSGFPYASSNAVVSSLAGTEIDGALAQDVAGLSGYLFWNESLYAELGGYRSAKQGAANALTGAAGPLDGTASNVIQGITPYWRVAYEYNHERSSIEAGLYGAD